MSLSLRPRSGGNVLHSNLLLGVPTPCARASAAMFCSLRKVIHPADPVESVQLCITGVIIAHLRKVGKSPGCIPELFSCLHDVHVMFDYPLFVP
jgi:hypothetical protein